MLAKHGTVVGEGGGGGSSTLGVEFHDRCTIDKYKTATHFFCFSLIVDFPAFKQ